MQQHLLPLVVLSILCCGGIIGTRLAYHEALTGQLGRLRRNLKTMAVVFLTILVFSAVNEFLTVNEEGVIQRRDRDSHALQQEQFQSTRGVSYQDDLPHFASLPELREREYEFTTANGSKLCWKSTRPQLCPK